MASIATVLQGKLLIMANFADFTDFRLTYIYCKNTTFKKRAINKQNDIYLKIN
jgi:hypothetical protein